MRTHRIELDGATAREKIGFAVNRRRAIAPFPPGSSIPRIDMADGAAAKRLHGARQALGPPGITSRCIGLVISTEG
jgi:hypothetical protein